MPLGHWQWYHVALAWILSIAACAVLFRTAAQTVLGKSDSGGVVGLGVPVSLIVIYAVVLPVLVVMTATWLRAR